MSSPSTPASPQPRPAAKYQDCLPCKVVGATTFGALGGYALYEARRLGRAGGRGGTAVTFHIRERLPVVDLTATSYGEVVGKTIRIPIHAILWDTPAKVV
ncbi:hypothetical protein BC936DRAFT_138678 [Jimgerdemannia flammicorona]|uniref:Distal membrane-arm assembly complex protein 1-like domain-containing protein n=1 Tax=Jimgerdemannia flammicorona TaxID=994334 RepID=A0A433BTM7_9FUNG|nr:hypothetical protein BC936DRAFT_138678 [Jimgerdemannia flammicorona]